MLKTSLLFATMLVLSISVKAQQSTVQHAAASVDAAPQEVSVPSSAGTEIRSSTAADLNGRTQEAAPLPSSTAEFRQNTQAELPAREKTVDD